MAVEPREKELHRVAVTGIIWKEEDGKRVYLITKRSAHKKAWPNLWTVPGGGMEVDDYINTTPSFRNAESPQWYGALDLALRREIKEEVNLEVGEVHYLMNVAAIRPDGVPVLVLSMYCKYKSGDVKLDEDATEYAWITADEVGKYALIQGIDDEIKEADKRLSKQS